MSERLVVCDGVGRTFGSGNRSVVAVHGVSCTVLPTSRVALVGPSGSGKSTLLHLMAGLDNPTSGSIDWPLWSTSPYGDPSRAGMVFQGLSLIPNLSAVENAAFPLLLLGIGHEEATARALESLRLLGIGSLADKLPDELSGGQSQRVAVARVIATRPRLIFADEPTGQLDRVAGQLVVDLLLDAAAHLEAGLVVSTHDPVAARRLDTRWTMHDGELAA